MSHSQPVRPASQNSFVWVSAGLAIASAFIGVALFLAACAGFDGAFQLALIPAILGGVSLVLLIVAVNIYPDAIESAQVVAGLFVSLFGLLGGLIELAVVYNWPIFPIGK